MPHLCSTIGSLLISKEAAKAALYNTKPASIQGSMPTGIFLATSCGKGAVVGVGGTVKQQVFTCIKSRSHHVTDAELCPKCIRKNKKSTHCMLMKLMSSNKSHQYVMSGQLSELSHIHTHCIRCIGIGVVTASHYSAQAAKLCTTSSHQQPCCLTTSHQQPCHQTTCCQPMLRKFQGCS